MEWEDEFTESSDYSLVAYWMPAQSISSGSLYYVLGYVLHRLRDMQLSPQQFSLIDIASLDDPSSVPDEISNTARSRDYYQRHYSIHNHALTYASRLMWNYGVVVDNYVNSLLNAPILLPHIVTIPQSLPFVEHCLWEKSDMKARWEFMVKDLYAEAGSDDKEKISKKESSQLLAFWLEIYMRVKANNWYRFLKSLLPVQERMLHHPQ